MDYARQKIEVDRNYDRFVRILGELLPKHRDQLVLMSNGSFGGLHERLLAALRARAAPGHR